MRVGAVALRAARGHPGPGLCHRLRLRLGEHPAVGPGIWGFIAFFVLAIALTLLVRNMNSRLRRMAYTDRERARAAEAAEAARTAENDGDDGNDGAVPPSESEPGDETTDGPPERR